MDIDDIALTLQRGLGPKTVAHLLSVMGSARAVYAAGEDELIGRAALKREVAKEISRKEFHKEAERELRFLEKNWLWAVASTDELYPSLLRECPDYPHVIYGRGNMEVLGARMLSMVGTRKITPYGQRMCDVLVGRLAELVPGTVVVSGLAVGVDANCHKAALRHGLPTVAVLPNALPGVMPSINAPLADEIVDRGGALITELYSGTKFNGAYYIPRNRIVAGVSEGTVVVESPSDGGALSTASLADGYNRTVMAVPGRAGDRCSDGTNMLIKSRRAAMVCSGGDIVHELGWNITKAGMMPPRPESVPVLSEDERRLLRCFGEGECLNLDALSLRSGIAVGAVAALLLGLEIAGTVRSLPGKTYEMTPVGVSAAGGEK